ncbi:MAG TPA: HAD-IIIC family phosphatase [Solirubrobacterales bacterium]|nr:HAD-IIIC family phosphatase [Solirubrobacterales bacterium]
MRLRTALTDSLRTVVRPEDELVVLHSSLFHVASSADSVKWEALAAVRAMAEAGHTLALPAFTFSFIRDGRYHHRRTRSGSGQLADWVYELPEARRTPHPVYSYVVLGPRRDDLLACRQDAAFGAGTVFELFESENARIVMVGSDWQELTQVHRCEELLDVPYRTEMRVEGVADFGAGEVRSAIDLFVRDTGLESVRDFTPVIEELQRRGAFERTELGRGAVEATSCDDVGAATRQLLEADPYALLRSPRVVERRVQRKGLAPVRLALVGAQNVDLLADAVRGAGEELLDCRPLEVQVPPYGQHVREILDSRSALRQADLDCSFFADRLEDVYGCVDLDSLGDLDTGPLDAHLGLLAEYAARVSSPIAVLTFADLRPRPVLAGGSPPSPTRRAADHGNRRLAELAAEHDNVHLLDCGALAASYPGPVFDDRLWHVGRLPFTQGFGRRLAERLWGLVIATRGEGARLVALDLDGTLWGGVLGEEDVAGVAIGGDYPGNAFAHFQRALLSLQRAGVALALCSKNDEQHALRVLQERPEMVLNEEDLVGWKIDWEAKSKNLADLAAELGIDLEHVLFVDDNPVEREGMRQRLPAVKVLDLPPDPALYADALASSPYLTRIGVTDEDRQRTQRYRARRLVESERRAFDDPESFYSSLEMTVSFSPLSEANAARAEQLSQKTNQFNTTTRRYRRGDLQALAESDGAEVVVIGLSDRFSEREHVGLVVLRYGSGEGAAAEVDSLLLSCRVLGRGVEQGVVAWVAARARARGMASVLGAVVPTPRNGPCRDVFRQAGFDRGEGEGEWILDLTRTELPLPRWLQIETEVGAG